MLFMSQILEQLRHPEPIKNLVESSPVKEGTKLSSELQTYSWEDVQGLSWLFLEDWS